jgi:asparagine synthase (glutamine-hydrolysing)
LSGFFGMLRQDGKPVEERFLQRIVKELSSRGPDGTNIWKQGNLGGCFTFMRTGPAPQTPQQPVHGGNGFWLWGDLRLDARCELQLQLEEKDCPAQAKVTSEELLLRAWEEWGPASLERLIGDFSFALWDAKEETLWCARDFIGARPFYYAQANGVFCFSNTLQILQLVPEISAELDESFLGDFLIEGRNVEATSTVYRDIKRLAAGHFLRLSERNAEIRRFKKLPIEKPLYLKRPEEYLEVFRDLLKIAVLDRLPGQETALYLSGGLDSSSVCAMASQIAGARAQKEKLKAFTLSWESFFADPEPALAKLTARHLGIAHEVLQEPYLKPFEGAETEAGRTPEPDGEIFFSRDRRNSQKIAAYSNVVLAGDGGDDILTGQAWPYLSHLWRKWEWKQIVRDFGGYLWTHRNIPPLGAGFRTRIGQLINFHEPLEEFPSWLNDEFARRTNLKQRWYELQNRKRDTEHPFHPLAYEFLHNGIWSSILETEDAGWNRVQLETRAPLLDLRMLTLLLRLPPVPWCMDKELCRQAMKHALPPAVVERPKTPLLVNPIECCEKEPEWISSLPERAPGQIEQFVNWSKWCETLYSSKGSLRWTVIRPIGLFRWLKAVENK